MTESAALLVDKVLPEEPAAMGEVLAIVYRALASHRIEEKAGLTLTTGQTGAGTLALG